MDIKTLVAEFEENYDLEENGYLIDAIGVIIEDPDYSSDEAVGLIKGILKRSQELQDDTINLLDGTETVNEVIYASEYE
jgi:hypothetical protein